MSNDKKLDEGEIILGIIDIFDTAWRLEAEVNRLNREKDDALRIQRNGGEASGTDAMILAVGKQKVLDDALYSWFHVKASRDEETGEVSVTGYDTWLKEKVTDIPGFMSRDEFLRYFDRQLRKKYEAEKDKALAKLADSNDE